MTGVVLLSVYCGAFLFIVGCVWRVLQYRRTPVHLRWELYPVPHEKRERVVHGGSYFEEVDWWTKKRSRNVAGEIRFMLPEMLLLRGLWEFNRKLWFRSFPFHAGLFLLIAAAVGSLANAGLEHWVVLPGVRSATGGLAWMGLVLTLAGAASLLWRRVFDAELRNYTTAGDIFNVGMFAAFAALVIIGRLIGPMPSLSALAGAVLRFDTSLHLPGAAACGLLIGSFMAGYVPFTHMAHFVAKYFTYHEVRWDDAPLAFRREMATRVAKQLAYRPTWAARHVGADGVRSWADVATSTPATKAEEVRK